MSLLAFAFNRGPFPPPKLLGFLGTASPPPHTARPVSRELPVDPYCNRRRSDGTRSLVLFHRHRPSPLFGRVSSCIAHFEACAALDRKSIRLNSSHANI